jgi:hypothetical protein
MGAHIHTVAALLLNADAGFFRVAHPATAEGAIAASVNFGIKLPALLTGTGIKGNNPIEWCAVHQALSSIYRQQDGRTLGGSFGHFLAVGIHIAVARYPGNFQVFYVFSIDLCGVRIMAAALVAPII